MPLPIHKYRLLPNVGGHVDENREFRSGDVFESYMRLDVMFANKFEKLPDTAEVPDENCLPPLLSDDEAEPEKAEPSKVAGTDVTADFKGASDLGIKVVKTGKVYSVFDADHPASALEGGDALKSKAAVEAFIASISA
jgi:hypothetical protein